MAKMGDEEVVKRVNAELARADSFMENRIGYERALAYDYYYGREFGNEQDGRSRVVSADVAQVIDAALPQVVEVFVSGDKAVEFTPRKEEDVQGAEQATIGANYVYFTQNNGYALAHDFIKDGMLQKTGAFKWKWDTSVAMVEKRYQSLPEASVVILSQSPDVEIIEHSARVDEMTGQPVFDVTTRQKKTSGKVRVIVPPPEEIKISPDSTTLEVMDMPFIAHTPLLSRSDLVELGIDQKVIDTLPKGDTDPLELERIARRERVDAVVGSLDEPLGVEAYRYNECYIRLDEDGDGVAELRKICIVGNTILHDEPTDHIPIAIWTPKAMPHEVIGISLADDVMDLQLLKSAIWRQVMDNLYLSNAPRLFAQGDINLDDVLTVKPGGVIRGEANSALTPITVPFTAGAGFQMLEYTDQEKDARVGFSALGPGMDPDSINKTATFVVERQNQANARAKMIARNAAEFGFKPLFKGIMYLLSKHQQEALMVRLNNKFVPIDPETWSKEYDMSCNVGLGVGNKEQQLMQLQGLGMDLQAIGQSPFASLLLDAQKIYNFFEKKANLAGFKDASVFINNPIDPNTGQPLPPPPPPKPESVQVAEIKAQADAQNEQMKLQAEGEKTQMQMAADREREGNQAQADMMVAQNDAQMKAELERYKIDKQAELELFKARLNADVELQKAAMMAEVARNRPEPRPGA
jgi:hypothetical protein